MTIHATDDTQKEHADASHLPREEGECKEGKKPFVPPRVTSEGPLTKVTTQFIGQFTA